MQNDYAMSVTPPLFRNGFTVPETLLRHPGESQDGPKLLILPFVKREARAANHQQSGEIRFERPEYLAIGPAERLCFGVPLTLAQFLCLNTNLNAVFATYFVENIYTMPATLLGTADEVLHIYGDTFSPDFVVQGVIDTSSNVEGIELYIMDVGADQTIWQFQSLEYGEDNEFYQAAINAMTDCANMFGQQGYADMRASYLDYYQTLFQAYGPVALIQREFYLFDLYTRAKGHMHYTCDTQANQIVLDNFYQSMANEELLGFFDTQAAFLAAVNLTNEIDPDAAQAFCEHIRNMASYCGMDRTAILPLLLETYQKLNMDTEARTLQKALLDRFQDGDQWLSQNAQAGPKRLRV